MLRSETWFTWIITFTSGCLLAMSAAAWVADNGNGTFTNPIFHDEFSDPDLIRVGDDFYMTGTTMHSMPGLPVLHSKDLVNWTLLSYAFDELDLGPEFHLRDGQSAYGAGIWAPAIRYHKGKFYIFSNVNGHGMQVFSATDPAGPWEHWSMNGRIYDSSILFDDDGRIYAISNYDEVKLTELKPDLSGPIAGTEKVIIPAGSGMGEGHHVYKVDGKYFIISANYAPVGNMQAARSDNIEGPYEIVTISARETMGTQMGWWTDPKGPWSAIPGPKEPLSLRAPEDNAFGAVPLHQGGIVDLPNGDWWGWSMMDVKSAGRMTFLSPVTWHEGWPYFGLPNNLGRSPRTWYKPAVENPSEPTLTFERDDDFSSSELKPLWQWNHIPDAKYWSLTEKPGVLRLHTQPAPSFMAAKNSLTQRVMGPESWATVVLDGTNLKDGDIAGLGLMGLPYYWIALERDGKRYRLHMYDQVKQKSIKKKLKSPRIWLRAGGDFDRDQGALSYSTDGKTFKNVGGELRFGYQLKTFQGLRFTLFAFNRDGEPGGYADFDNYSVAEPLADRSNNIPFGKTVRIVNLADQRAMYVRERGMLYPANPEENIPQAAQQFVVHDRGQGRVALESVKGGFLQVVGEGLPADVRLTNTESENSLFMWQDMLDGEFMLLSLHTQRHLGVDSKTNEPYAGDWPGARPDRKGGVVLRWVEVTD